MQGQACCDYPYGSWLSGSELRQRAQRRIDYHGDVPLVQLGLLFNTHGPDLSGTDHWKYTSHGRLSPHETSAGYKILVPFCSHSLYIPAMSPSSIVTTVSLRSSFPPTSTDAYPLHRSPLSLAIQGGFPPPTNSHSGASRRRQITILQAFTTSSCRCSPRPVSPVLVSHTTSSSEYTHADAACDQ